MSLSIASAIRAAAATHSVISWKQINLLGEYDFRRTDFGRQILRADDQLFGDTMDRRVPMRHVPVGTDHARAEAPGNLRRGAADAAPGADQQNRLTGLEACRFEAAPGGHVVDPDRRCLVEARRSIVNLK